ncbi:DUF4288 domain-containing protein [Desulfosarcina sp. OttesenSCG-928-B08]|nr:DUF4288 domain-containing protein [Desulfosarcina sp. OttesenSCG-928-B08]
MTWFAAHAIMYVQYKHEKQGTYPVWENIYLIEAASDNEAYEKAQARGREDEGDSSGTFEWDGKQATWIFAGIRKIIECRNSADQLIHAPLDDRPGDGTEITYSELEVKNKEDLEKLINGDPVFLIYEE